MFPSASAFLQFESAVLDRRSAEYIHVDVALAACVGQVLRNGCLFAAIELVDGSLDS